MLEAKLPSHVARSHPLPPRRTRRTNTMLAQPFRKHSRLNRVRAKQEIENAVLNPSGDFQGVRGPDQNVVVERGTGANDFAARRESHDDSADNDGSEIRVAWGEVGVLKVLGHDGGGLLGIWYERMRFFL